MNTTKALFGASLATTAGWGVAHRRSPLVSSWAPSHHPVETSGEIAVRSFGSGADTVLLLHGLVATGDIFGRAYDALGSTHRVVVPDLLGFGRSLDERRSDFGLDAHLDAIDEVLARTAPDMERLTIGAHSMGSAVAVALAARHPDLVVRVACFGAPAHRDEDRAKRAIATTSPMARLLVGNETFARRVCRLNCANRQAAGWFASAVGPQFPTTIARSASLHTWEAYHQSLQQLVYEFPWRQRLGQIAAAGTPTRLTWGSEDSTGDPAYASSLLDPASQTSNIVDGAGHHLPVTHTGEVLRQLQGYMV